MSALAITAITNFLLACQVFLLAGMLIGSEKTVGSAAWFWSLTILLLGTSALLGGIDHGFVEPLGQTRGRVILERSNWSVLGLMTLCMWMTLARQFFSPQVQKWILVLAVVQFILFVVLVITVGQFLVVIVNYAPVMLLFLIMNIIGLKNGTGSWPMIAGIVIMFIASGLQALGVDTFSPLDRNGLYHVVAMVGVVFLYIGGIQLGVG